MNTENTNESKEPFLLIPLKDNAQTAIKIYLSEMPPSLQMIDILRDEEAPIWLWRRCAIEYLRDNQTLAFTKILESGCHQINDYSTGQDQNTIKQKCMLLNSLAVFYIGIALTEKDPRKRDSFLNNAREHLGHATKLDQDFSMTWVNKGLLLATQFEWEKTSLQLPLKKVHNNININISSSNQSQNNLDRAYYNLNMAQETDPSNIYVHHAKASVCIMNQDYRGALGIYTRIYNKFTEFPPSVQFGKALCHFHLLQYNECRCEFKKILSRQKDSIPALLGLAILDLHENPSSLTSLTSAYTYLSDIFKISPQNSSVLNMLADHYFKINDFKKSMFLVKKALENTYNTSSIQSESHYCLGRLNHVTGDFDQALIHYQKAITFSPRHYPALYCLAQIYLKKHKIESAINSLKPVSNRYSDNYAVIRLFGILCGRTGRKPQAIALLKKAVTKKPNDYISWLNLAVVLQSTEPEAALDAYLKAIHSIQKNDRPVNLEIWNNLGAIFFTLKNYDSSRKAFEKAQKTISDSDLIMNHDSIMNHNNNDLYMNNPPLITTRYNYARLLENTGNISKAEELYKEILTILPSYSDCYFRLVVIAITQGKLTEALEILNDKCSKYPTKVVETQVLISVIQKKLGQAEKSHKTLLDLSANSTINIHHDSYAILSLANSYLGILTRQPSSKYAACGIGIVLAKKGKYNEAKEIFIQARDAGVPGAWVNLAHVYEAQKQHAQAAQIYLKSLRIPQLESYEFENNIYLCCAKSFYNTGDLVSSKNILEEAIYRYPFDNYLWYGLALCQQERSMGILRLSKTQRELNEVRIAVKELSCATRIFHYLETTSVLDVIKQKSKNHAEFCEMNLPSAMSHLKDAIKQDEKRQASEKEAAVVREEFLNQMNIAKKQKEDEEENRRIAEQEMLEQHRKKLKLDIGDRISLIDIPSKSDSDHTKSDSQ